MLDAEGLDASDFIDVINALSNIKKRDAEKEAKEQEKKQSKRRKYLPTKSTFTKRERMFLYTEMEGPKVKGIMSEFMMTKQRKYFLKA